jgi:hypothetical protein
MPSFARSASRMMSARVIVVLASAVPAGADTIHITSGALQMGTTSGRLSITGDRGFLLIAGVDASGGVYAPWEACSVPECGGGSVIPLAASWSGNDLPGVAALDGSVYPQLGSLSGEQSASVQFVGQAVAPLTGVAPSVVISAPFTFAGLFIEPVGSSGGAVWHDLVGAGTATLWLEQNLDGTTWRAAAATYQFDPVATPEPGTLLLLASGLGLATVRGRIKDWRRCRRSSSRGRR